MNLLGFDTATPATAVALQQRDGALEEARDDPQPDRRPHHTSDLLGLAAGLLDAAALDWSDLDAIAVGLGPGTFTGLRVGVATARGLAQALGVPLIGISSLKALALPALAASAQEAAGSAAEPPPDPESPVLAVLDARRGEVFLAAYARGPAIPELLAPSVLKPDGIAAAIAPLDDAAPIAVGDGATRYAAELQAAGAVVAEAGSPLHRLRAACVCELALRQGAGQPLEMVLPSYGRRPDAEIAIEGAPR